MLQVQVFSFVQGKHTVVGTDFSLQLLEIQPPFILINVIFSKEKEKPIPNLWVEIVGDLICIQPSQCSPVLA